ncbi:hypothetical protein V4U86_23370 [Mycobacterium sp. AMU20-3851]|uniref:hypothetical protein n=1 Tax=Mycobacterium sp. AMU20-3851 TaxID=3122055 RepID=UPI003754E921
MNDSLTLIVLLAGQGALAGWLMWRSPYNPVSVVGTLTTVFSFLPALLFLNDSGFESYSWRNYATPDATNGFEAAALIGILNSCLLLGAVAAEQSRKREPFLRAPQVSAPPRGMYLYGSKKLGLVSAVYFMLWLVVAVILYGQSGQTVAEFLLPIKETGIASEQSGYLRSLYLALPSALVVMSYWRHGSLKASGWIWVVLALVATFSTHQRRELVTTALLLLSLGMFLGPLRDQLRGRVSRLDPSKNLRQMRMMIVVVLLAGLLLVPLLWYARVYFTNWGEGDEVNVFEIRSFTDILFGSPSTGFPTLVYIQDFVSNFGTDPLYLLAYPLTIFIPRALWESKPLDLDSILESQYWLMENPSSFWFGEMYYGLGYLAPLATLILAFLLYRFCLKCQFAPNIWYRTMGAILFMQCVTLFKNGVTVFIIRTLVLVALLGAAWIVCRPSRDEMEPAASDEKQGVLV